jgi:hypothetical protein
MFINHGSLGHMCGARLPFALYGSGGGIGHSIIIVVLCGGEEVELGRFDVKVGPVSLYHIY